jgi:hypothetical protein
MVLDCPECIGQVGVFSDNDFGERFSHSRSAAKHAAINTAPAHSCKSAASKSGALRDVRWRCILFHMTKLERPICSEKVMLHLPPDLRGALERAALAERRSLSFMARLAVERLLAERGQTEKAA